LDPECPVDLREVLLEPTHSEPVERGPAEEWGAEDLVAGWAGAWEVWEAWEAWEADLEVWEDLGGSADAIA